MTGSDATYTATIEPIFGKFVEVSVLAGAASDSAGNPNTASNTFIVQAGSPASEFEKYLPEIRQVIVDEAERALRSTLSVNQRMVRDARERFIAGQGQTVHCSELIADNPDITFAELEGCDDGVASRNNVPFDVTGIAGIEQPEVWKFC